mmetsp:Transcript_35640/g.32115  ORF Transcript_35640/g.32115 Transcript_35640/m.32115 type:complete len:157 (+) Transcript_35640:151-621(+)
MVEAILRPIKYIYPYERFLFYCDVPLMVHEGKIAAEISLFNTFKTVKSVCMDGSKKELISAVIGKNDSVEVPHWKYELEKMKESKGPENEVWVDQIQNFCESYEEALRNFGDSPIVKSVLSGDDEKIKYINNFNDKKREEILASAPCLEFRLTANE